jgi:rubrerythrin
MRECAADLLDLLAEHELALERLYEVYAEKLPAWSRFWLELATEESEHEQMIRSLKDKLEQGSISCRPGRFSVEALKNSLDYLRGELARARALPIELSEALSTARDVEDALIERHFFDVFDGDSEELAKTLRVLAARTSAHRSRALDAWSSQH